MELKKKKYSAKEVSQLLEEQANEYREKLSQQKTRIDELIADNKKLIVEVSEFVSKKELIDNALIKAQKDAQDLTKNADMQYALTVEKLKIFYTNWNKFFSNLFEKYPLYDEVKKANALMDKLKELIGVVEPKKVVKELDEMVEKHAEDKPFNPKQRINDYIVATSENGFSLEEVLNPGELKLEDICKELGLIGEE